MIHTVHTLADFDARNLRRFTALIQTTNHHSCSRPGRSGGEFVASTESKEG